jgi:hypothetical protein
VEVQITGGDFIGATGIVMDRDTARKARHDANMLKLEDEGLVWVGLTILGRPVPMPFDPNILIQIGLR